MTMHTGRHVTDLMSEVAVIVPTLDRPRRAVALAWQLCHLDPRPAEIVFVFQRSSEQEVFRLQAPAGVASVMCPVKSAGAARNFGLSKCRGEFAAFIDDDCEPVSPQWASRLVESLLVSDCDLATGAVLGWAQSGGLGRKVLRRGNVVLPLLLHPLSNCESDRAGAVDTVWGCNFAARRSALEAVGGFSPLFSSPSLYEETELSLRVRRLRGSKVQYVPAASIRHVQAADGGQRPGGMGFSRRFLGREKAKLVSATYFPRFWRFVAAIFVNLGVFPVCYALRDRSVQSAISYISGFREGCKRYSQHGGHSRQTRADAPREVDGAFR